MQLYIQAMPSDVKFGMPHHKLLTALGRFGFLTALQCRDLLYSRGKTKGKGSLSFVFGSLRELYDWGFVGRTRTFNEKMLPYTFFLTRKGFNYLVNSGMNCETRFRSPAERLSKPSTLAHTLDCNSILILCYRFTKEYAGAAITRMRTESELRRQRVEIRDPSSKKGNKIRVVPDGWLSFILHNALEYPLAWEIDRGTHEAKRFREKIRGLVEFNKGAYQKMFETDYLTVLFVVTAGESKRLAKIVKWTEEELRRTKDEAAADLFRFAAFDPRCADPGQIFLAPIWVKPFQAEPVSLIGD